jgi:SnoaL-like domain
MALTRELNTEDRQEIRDLIVEFAWRVDHGRADTIHELVTKDAEIQMHYGPMIGIDAIVAWGKERSTVNRTTRHVMTNFRFRAHGYDRAGCTSLSLTFLHNGSGVSAALPWAVTEFEDVFVRGDHGWLFARRTSTDIFLSE